MRGIQVGDVYKCQSHWKGEVRIVALLPEVGRLKYVYTYSEEDEDPGSQEDESSMLVGEAAGYVERGFWYLVRSEELSVPEGL